MKRLDVLLIVAALLIAFVTITAVIVRAGGHDQRVISPAPRDPRRARNRRP